MGATWTERIIRALNAASRPLDDDELTARLGAPQRQVINQACRRLERQGVIRRRQGSSGKIVNALTADSAVASPPPVISGVAAASELLSEDAVKSVIKADLEARGWLVQVAWGRTRGVDLACSRGRERLFLEAKGAAANPPQQVNYFLGALGELIQRMDVPEAQYGLALPDNRQYRGLVQRLPGLTWERLHLVAALVSAPDRTVTWIERS